MSERTRIDIDLRVTGTEPKLPPDVTLGMFRIAQEALTNVERHAKATQVRVMLEYSAEEIALDIDDNGIGLDPSPASGWDANSHQLGLIGMKERTDLLGGTIKFISRPGSGSSISLRVPLSTAATS